MRVENKEKKIFNLVGFDKLNQKTPKQGLKKVETFHKRKMLRNKFDITEMLNKKKKNSYKKE